MSEPPYPLYLQRLVEEYLEGLDFGADRRAARLVEAMRYSLLAGGKRIRPVLTLAVVESRGFEPATVLPTAAALELIHTYSLIHDDLPSIDDDDLRAMHGLKTGKLIEAAVVVGALLSGAGGERGAAACSGAAAGGAPHATKDGGGEVSGEIAAYRAFATELGVLFQIVDDILDETGDAAVLGKTAGKDRTQEKATYVALFGLDEARRLAEETHGRALDALRALPGDTAVLTQIAGYILHRKN
jgi:geranylgeranyl diphosphate synthase type II